MGKISYFPVNFSNIKVKKPEIKKVKVRNYFYNITPSHYQNHI